MNTLRTVAIVAAGVVAGACAPGEPRPAHAPEPEASGDEAVQVGYGTQDRDKLAGAVTSVTAEDLRAVRATRVEELLQGRVPGLQVIRHAGGISLRLRGTTSILGSTEPLVVIDGMPVRPEGLMDALAVIDPRDVARIDVLKDAATTAIYGSRGANGVIMITTRGGR